MSCSLEPELSGDAPPDALPPQAVVYAKAPAVVGYLSGSDAGVAALAVLYLRARSWGLPAALVMMVAIGAGRWARRRRPGSRGEGAGLLSASGGFARHWLHARHPDPTSCLPAYLPAPLPLPAGASRT